MSYLSGYGVEDAKRSRVIRWIVLSVILAAVLGTIGYFSLRDYRERSHVASFLDHLRRGDYRGAYRMWGCTESTPCRDYAFDKFMEDWGPKSPQASVAGAELGKSKWCDSAVIQIVQFPGNQEVQLWVQRDTRTIGFNPWPVTYEPGMLGWLRWTLAPCRAR